MSYQITLTNGTVLAVIPNNTLNNTTSLTLIGQDYIGYGTILSDNFVRLLENAANTTAPPAPLIGQLWFNTSTNLLEVWSGSNWLPTGAAPITNSPTFTGIPTAPTASLGTNTTQIATTAFVISEIDAINTGVISVIGNTGAVTLLELTSSGLSPSASPTLTGVPLAPTASAGTNTTQIATTAFVTAATAVGALTTAGMAPLASPALTGVPTAPTASATTATTQLATTAFVANSLASTQNTVNMLINPGLTVQQMNPPLAIVSGSNLNNIYMNDGWLLNCFGVPSMTASTVAMPDAGRAAVGTESAQYMFQISTSGTPGANDYALFSQRLENNYLFSNRYVVVSFWANATPVAGGAKLCLEFAQNFGSGGSPSAIITGIGQTVFTLNGTWTYYTSPPIFIPSVAGKVFGTSPNTNYLALRFWLTAGVTIGASAGNIGSQAFTLNMWNPQLEIGTTATPATLRPYSVELGLCQRYFQTGTFMDFGYGPGASNLIDRTMLLPTPMRIPGTVVSSWISAVNVSGNAINIMADSATVRLSAMSTGLNPYGMYATFTASAVL